MFEVFLPLPNCISLSLLAEVPLSLEVPVALTLDLSSDAIDEPGRATPALEARPTREALAVFCSSVSLWAANLDAVG